MCKFWKWNLESHYTLELHCMKFHWDLDCQNWEQLLSLNAIVVIHIILFSHKLLIPPSARNSTYSGKNYVEIIRRTILAYTLIIELSVLPMYNSGKSCSCCRESYSYNRGAPYYNSTHISHVASCRGSSSSRVVLNKVGPMAPCVLYGADTGMLALSFAFSSRWEMLNSQKSWIFGVSWLKWECIAVGDSHWTNSPHCGHTPHLPRILFSPIRVLLFELIRRLQTDLSSSRTETHKTPPKKTLEAKAKNIQQQVFAGGHPPNY